MHPSSVDSTLQETDSVTLQSSSTTTINESSEEFLKPLKKKMRKTRDELSATLKDRRNSRSIKKISLHDQMLNLSKEDAEMKKEDMALKKKLFHDFESLQKQLNEHIKHLTDSVTKTMTDGFQMMKMLLYQGSTQCNPHFNNGVQRTLSFFQNKSVKILILCRMTDIRYKIVF